MKFGDFIQRWDGALVQDRRLLAEPINTVVVVYPDGRYTLQSGEDFDANAEPKNFGKCVDSVKAQSVADATGWEP